MRLSFEPIRPAHAESLKEHLAPFGLPPDIVDWKYFKRPWQDDLTGLVWLKDGRVRGAIGLIPFEVRTGDRRIRAAWTCDWVVDAPQANPGIGVMLMQRARALAGPLFSLGGNDVNRNLMPRIATAWQPHAAVEMYLPLRLGGSRLFRGVNRRLGGALSVLGAASPLARAATSTAVAVPGVARAVASVIDSIASADPIPSYTADYLRWQLELCPDIEVASVLTPGDPRAAALCWSKRSAATDWRVALWTLGSNQEALDVLDGVVAHAHARGGERLSVLSAQADAERIRWFEDYGFATDGATRPLFITGEPGTSPKNLAGLSFLDTDLAYRI